ncbi:MAG: NAD(P)H-dependent oxidoreductase [Solobacterium sp.]|nr:NAD(P)H-dependent oxidoreductase [Solobacterium sp.]
MKILVLNGSPAGPDSITLQTVHYLQAAGLIEEMEIRHIGREIKKIEKDFGDYAEALEKADLILFCYPVYTFLVPAQLHRFIELMKEHEVDVRGKYAAQITTSKHFYDVTAHRFIIDNCADLGLKYAGGLSADMEDLLQERGQKEAEDFFRYVLWQMANGFAEKPVVHAGESEHHMAAAPCLNMMKKSGRAALVYDDDSEHPKPYLQAMIKRLVSVLNMDCELVNLHDFPFAGGCIGCFRCASDGKCFHRDGFDSYLREHINSADVIVYAFTVKDHSMGSIFKTYDDRQFCNGHRTVTMGKPVGYLVSGSLSAEENLRTVMHARAQVGGNYLAGIVTDETDPDAAIEQLARTLAYALDHHYEQPADFYGVGGMKIFRDLIWQMQGLMKEDHRFYKEHGFYDFPQKHPGRMLGMYAVSALMNSPLLQKKSGVSMTEGMLMPYRAVIEKAKKK